MKNASKVDKQPIKAIIFDFDDTLVSTSSVYKTLRSRLNAFGKKHYGISNVGDAMDISDKFFSTTVKKRKIQDHDRVKWAAIAGEKLGVHFTQKQCKELSDEYWRAFFEHTIPLPYAKEVLSKLKKDYLIFLLSDSDGAPSIKMKRIRLSGLYKYFDDFSTGDKLNVTKPDILYYSYLLKKYKLKGKECIMVGDRPPHDLEFAKRVGMHTVWIQQGLWQKLYKKKLSYVDYIIKNLKGVLDIL
ncbi:MAG TPA: HAD family hydrolase [Candidatus Nanoarchaeia archaeon]|nr:HAD family hydrolase [Candidatus Nanoarchaeia archaeon]